jgi:glycosyltransferase involved in cell wall biosynthesis
MKILHVIDSLAIGGAERMLVDIANATIIDGHSVGVCVTRSSRVDLAKELHPEIRLQVIHRTRRFDLGAMKQFRDYVVDNCYDVLHVHGRSSLSFCSLTKLLFKFRIPLLFHDHRSIEIDQSIPVWLRIWGKHYVEQYVGVYETLGRWAEKAGIESSKISVIGNGLELKRLQKEPQLNIRKILEIPDSHLLGAVVAGLRIEKGLDLLIQAISKCDRSDFNILICGGFHDLEYVENCQLLAKKLGVDNRLIFWGERDDIPGILSCCDFALMPSRSESGPLVLIEYLAIGLPVVAFRVGDITNIATIHGVPGIVDPNDIDAFADAIINVIALDIKERKTRGNLGREIAERVFSIQSKMPTFYEVYRQAITQK